MSAWLRASRLLLLWLCLSAPFTAPGAATEKDDTATWSTSAESRLKQINALIKDWQREPPTDRAFGQVQQEIAALRERAERCVTEYESGLASIQQKISALGEPDSSAAAEVRDALRRFQQQQQTTERQLAVCRLIELINMRLETVLRDLEDRVDALESDVLGEPNQVLRQSDHANQVYSKLQCRCPREPAAELGR